MTCSPSDSQISALEETRECFEDATRRDDIEGCLRIAESEFGENWDHGNNRFVFYFDECAVKLQMPTRPEIPRGSNEREVDVWESLPDSIRDWFLPVEDYDEEDYTWLTMKKVDTPDSREERMPFEKEEELRDELDEVGWRCADIRPSNFGKDNGEWVYFDYAECHDVSNP